jgi:tryptophanyl-tRNA synthetase
MTIVSGIQPSGRLHVGNELGAVRNWLRLQGERANRCFFFIADWHSLTEEYDPKKKAAQVRELAAELLVLGIATPSSSSPRGGGETNRAVLFRQSDLSEHLELAWYLACLTPVGSMERMTQYKDKLAQGESPNVGLFTYPVLMAADILAYSQNVGLKNRRTEEQKNSGIGVPVGDDQKQHLELANDIVRRFNNRYGQTFPEIQYLPAPVARVMSLKDPMKKMSKSLGGDHCLFLDDSPEEITRKLKAAVTDTGPGKTQNAERRTQNPDISPGVRTLFEILEAFGKQDEVTKFRKAHEVGAIKYSELKPAVAKAFAASHAEFRKKKEDLMAHPDRIDAALAAGAKAARAVASETLKMARERVGVR